MYIGAKPNVANFTMLDNITTSATATFNLTKDGVAYYPPNSLATIVSLNGIVQKATSSYNIVNNTIVFSQALTSNDVIDYILVMAEKIDLSIPADSSVTNAKTNFVSTSSNAGLQIKGDGTTAGTLELRCENNSHGVKLRGSAHSNSPNYVLTMPPNDGNADEFLKTDGSGNLSFATAGGGITEADYWRVTANTNANTNAYVTTNWERNDTVGFSKIGTGLSESSGVFSFPSTGIYLINYFGQFLIHGSDINLEYRLYTTINNSSYTLQTVAVAGISSNTDGVRGSASSSFIFDVTDTSQCKFKFFTDSFSGSTTQLIGDTSWTGTGFTAIKLGDT